MISRRRFLQGLAASALLGPFLAPTVTEAASDSTAPLAPVLTKPGAEIEPSSALSEAPSVTTRTISYPYTPVWATFSFEAPIHPSFFDPLGQWGIARVSYSVDGQDETHWIKISDWWQDDLDPIKTEAKRLLFEYANTYMQMIYPGYGLVLPEFWDETE